MVYYLGELNFITPIPRNANLSIGASLVFVIEFRWGMRLGTLL